jgi:hypothetical protein
MNEDLIGKKFSKLTVVKKSHKRYDGRMLFACLCDCGNLTYSLANTLRRGVSKSCGCLRGNPSHKRSKTRLYRIWSGMRSRCKYSNLPEYMDYGGRGIKVCDEWENNSSNFFEWAINNGYDDHLQIDRKDVNGDYCPENCRWITMQENMQNMRSNKANPSIVLQIRYIHKNTKQSHSSISEMFNMSRTNVTNIINRKIWNNIL